MFAGKSDSSVVNCIEGHPKLPVVAVSGIDHDIKIWEPRYNDTEEQSEDDRQWSRIPPSQYETFLDELSEAANMPPFRMYSIFMPLNRALTL